MLGSRVRSRSPRSALYCGREERAIAKDCGCSPRRYNDSRADPDLRSSIPLPLLGRQLQLSRGDWVRGREGRVPSRKDCLQLMRENEAVQRQINELAFRLENSMRASSGAELRAAELNDKCQAVTSKLNGRIDDLLTQNEEYRNLVAEAERQNRQLAEQSESSISKVKADSRREVEAALEERDRVRADLRQACFRLEQLRICITQISPSVDEVKRLKAENASLDSQKESLARQLLSAKLDNKALLQNLERLAGMSQGQASSSFSQIQQLSVQNEELAKRAQASHLRAEALSAETEKLRQLVKEYDSAMLAGRKHEFAASKEIDGRDCEIKALLADNVRLQGENERLIDQSSRLKEDFEVLLAKVESLKRNEHKSVFSEAIANRDKILALLHREPQARCDKSKGKGEALLRSELERSKAEVQRLVSQNQKLRKGNDKLQSQLQKCRLDYQPLQFHVTRLGEELSSVRAECERLRRESGSLKQKESELEKCRAQLERVRRELQTAVIECERVKVSCNEQGQRSREQLQRLRGQNKRLQSKIEEDERKRVDWMKEFENWRRQVEGFEGKESVLSYR